MTAVSPRLVTRVWMENFLGPSEGSVVAIHRLGVGHRGARIQVTRDRDRRWTIREGANEGEARRGGRGAREVAAVARHV